MEKTVEKKDRNVTVDVLRGELALLVLLGHAVQRSFPYTYESMYLFKIIYTFHMPFFILLSGYTSIYSDRFNLKNKILRLIYPTYLWTLMIYWLKDLKFTGLLPSVTFPETFKEYFKMILLRPDYVIWFLYVVFISALLVWIGKKIAGKYKLLFLAMVAVILVFFGGGVRTFGIYRIRCYFPFYILGYCMAEYKDQITSIFKKEYIKYLLVLVPAWLYLGNMWSFDTNVIIASVLAVLGMLCVYAVTEIGILKIKPAVTILKWIGRYSLEFYLLQILFLGFGIGEGIIRITITFIAAFICIIISIFISKKVSILNRFLFGK